MAEHSGRRFVFLDPNGQRWPRLRLALVGIGAVVFVALVLFIESLFIKPQLGLPGSVRKMKGQLKAMNAQAATASLTPMEWQKYAPKKDDKRPHKRAGAQAEIHLAYYVDWDSQSFLSLQKHAAQITHVSPEWLTMSEENGPLELDAEDRLENFAAQKGIVILPQLTNLIDGEWMPEAVESLLLGPPARRQAFIANLVAKLQNAKAGGVLVDWEGTDPTYLPQMTALLHEMADALHAQKLELWLTVPTGEGLKTYDLDAISAFADRFVAQIYDENSDDDEPGPLASQDWFEGWLTTLQEYGDANQWVIAIGDYGYDWTKGAKAAESISFADAMSRANNAGVSSLSVRAPSYNPQYGYSDPTGEHTVSFLDAVTFLNQLCSVRGAKMGGVAIFRLGPEDPKIWSVLALKDAAHPQPAELATLDRLEADDTVSNVGKGEVITVDDLEENGSRTLALDAAGHFTADYREFPSYPTIYHEGAGQPHEVAITFDDGPDPTWTPKILDILKTYNVQATFFMIGQQAEQNPSLVHRVYDEGHIIGNHTYTHANISLLSRDEVRLEFNATERLLESLLGRVTTICRPPYNADSRPSTLAEIRPLKLVQDNLDYLIVMEGIDPQDWARPGADEILNRIKAQREEGNIILLHDAGGNRAQTVEALPKIIAWLRERGDQIVPLSELMQIPRDDLMPPVKPGNDSWRQTVAFTGFLVWHRVEQFAWAFMIAITVLVLLRTIMVALLAWRNHARPRLAASHESAEPVSVIMAAFNEEKVIAKTIQSVLASDYAGEMEVLVIDDGSKDRTREVVQELAAQDARVRLIAQPNAGKSSALIAGLAQSRHEILVFLDADTLFEKQTIRELAAPLRNPEVGAVSGHARVGNLQTFITRCQALEYICGFNLDRRAYVEWDCITVVPGAVSALRKKAVVDAGGFSEDTLAEDTDLTLTMHERGWRVAYAHEAVAWTEAPETVRTLARQRFRWAFGTLQCLWKHRGLVFNLKAGALGWFSLPSVWVFQIFLVALSPVIDLVLILSLTSHGGALWIYTLAFLLMDLLLAFIACAMDGEKLRRAWTIVPMRFLYRPLLSYVIWRSIFRACKGALVGWGKLERTASVEVKA